DVDALVAVYTPPINTGGEDVANVLAAIGEQSDKPIVSTFLASKGIPVLLRVPDLQGGSAGRGSVPSYASPEAAVRALARAVNYAEWASRDHGTYQDSEQYRTGDAKTLIRSVLELAPRGAVLSTEQVHFLLS
ncbi:GNAT family N-acetyltransferase, partial [Aeromicrobium phragmitis]